MGRQEASYTSPKYVDNGAATVAAAASSISISISISIPVTEAAAATDAAPESIRALVSLPSMMDVAEDSKGRPLACLACLACLPLHLLVQPGPLSVLVTIRQAPVSEETCEQERTHTDSQDRPSPACTAMGYHALAIPNGDEGQEESEWLADPYKAMSACHVCPAHLYRRSATDIPPFILLFLSAHIYPLSSMGTYGHVWDRDKRPSNWRLV